MLILDAPIWIFDAMVCFKHKEDECSNCTGDSQSKLSTSYSESDGQLCSQKCFIIKHSISNKEKKDNFFSTYIKKADD